MKPITRQQALQVHRRARLRWEPSTGMHVLQCPGVVIELNDSAGWVLELLDGQLSVAGVIECLRQRFADVQGLEEDVLGFLELARARAWVE
ncbi:pyrroloquinoline quinone biosynthesis peptide chaperone PqqD [Pseudomonas fulva]|uniref:pyrroloquinoline quinone biosynthesis peptide chaperone PqqD n=1 Tax=Pseudomonas putida group TaxID=136845 RepID=UPI0018A9BDE2|nr:pyrroloquinoline quinone biosynthesis peptide chaperone PqqD [Pseudomonas putida]MBF8728137.1 pyrroloquinoline quinone biosynthesis peptide chaperone PqqD [Pseudomonas putida]